MTRHDDAWRLPGPQGFLKSVANDLYDGACVLLEEPFTADAVLRELEDQLLQSGVLKPAKARVGPDRSLLNALNEVCIRPTVSLAGLAAAPELRDCAFLLEVEPGADVQELDHFARAARLGGDSRAPVLLAVCGAKAPSLPDARWRRRRCEGTLGRLDAAAFAAQRLAGKDGLGTRLRASVAVEVGAWDLNVVEALLDLPLRDAIRPDLCVDRWLAGHEVAPNVPAAWEQRTADVWGGERTPHAAWLARHGRPELARRVWRGQLAALFPWVEERRREVITKNRARLRPDARSGDDIEMFDWGPLEIQLRNAPGCVGEVTRALRLVRNELAHGRPVDWPAVEACLQAVERWTRLG